jgi:murein L,D-transpeptidase YcbB/YkuD
MIRRSSTVIAVILLHACTEGPVSPPATTNDAVGAARPGAHLAQVETGIRGYLVSDGDPVFGEQTPGERVELNALYQAGGASPLWIDRTGRPGRQAHEAMAILRDARSEGLNPADYRHDQLALLSGTLTAPAEPSIPDHVTFDAALSRAMLRYLRHVHLGRLDPSTVGFRLTVPADRHDFATLLRAALTDDGIVGMIVGLRPALVQYDALRAILAKYRSLAADALELVPPAAAAVHEGQPYAGAGVLLRQLVAVGDLAAGSVTAIEPDTYDETLVEGVKRFQIRHGLEPDGVLGRGTQAALRVPLAWRVRQIELALERLRWLPDFDDRRLIAVNIPMFRFWAWDRTPPNDAPAFAMKVIVGRALSTETPVFDEEMREVIFRPYWNVPRSILLKEILPLIERDPGYLGRQNMEIVRGDSDEAAAVEPTAANLEMLRKGGLRVRQRPGPNNALGLIKFDFPNTENVYMHGTPAQSLFSQSRRDFSHGCIRVEDPIAFAEWLLRERPEWTRDRIVAAMAGTRSFRVRLPKPVQVLLYYTTAAVMPEDGTMHFAEDIYRHDIRLDRVLTRPPSAT